MLLLSNKNAFIRFLQVANVDFLDETALRNASTHAMDVMMSMDCVTMDVYLAG